MCLWDQLFAETNPAEKDCVMSQTLRTFVDLFVAHFTLYTGFIDRVFVKHAHAVKVASWKNNICRHLRFHGASNHA